MPIKPPDNGGHALCRRFQHRGERPCLFHPLGDRPALFRINMEIYEAHTPLSQNLDALAYRGVDIRCIANRADPSGTL